MCDSVVGVHKHTKHCSLCNEPGHNKRTCKHYNSPRFQQRLFKVQKFYRIATERINKNSSQTNERNLRATEHAYDYISSRANLELLVFSGKVPSDIGRHILEFIPKLTILLCSDRNITIATKKKEYNGEPDLTTYCPEYVEDELNYSWNLSNKFWISYSC